MNHYSTIIFSLVLIGCSSNNANDLNLALSSNYTLIIPKDGVYTINRLDIPTDIMPPKVTGLINLTNTEIDYESLSIDWVEVDGNTEDLLNEVRLKESARASLVFIPNKTKILYEGYNCNSSTQTTFLVTEKDNLYDAVILIQNKSIRARIRLIGSNNQNLADEIVHQTRVIENE